MSPHTSLQRIIRCEVCGNTDLIPVLDLGEQPLCDDLLAIGTTNRCETYPVELVGCAHCITVHQKYQVAKTTLFTESYHYRAALTKDVLDGMSELTDIAVREAGGDIAGKVVLDIGCNDGSLLVKMKSKGAFTVGIEPTGAARDAEKKVDAVIGGYFDAGTVADYLARFPKPDFITFTNVFAHISDLDAVLADLRTLMAPHTRLIIENHYLGAVIERSQFDTFYHEHPRTYSQRSFEVIAERLGLVVTSVDYPKRYNGNIRVVMAPEGSSVRPKTDEGFYLTAFGRMAQQIETGKARFLHKIRPYLEAYGPLPAKAFPGRAAIVVTSFGIDESMISAAYERSQSPKIGHRIPGTNIPILDEAELFAGTDAPAIVNLAWHISGEITAYLRAEGFTGEIIDVYEP